MDKAGEFQDNIRSLDVFGGNVKGGHCYSHSLVNGSPK